ncbi:hypothetical protein O1B18_003515 [Vibrio cholerae]|uniref:AbiU2 domain-containing protein n=1 Tax=Vibrio cholerae TaxID=666 RepID=UPI0011D585BB|nr:hypothetical protein [Vibrio cholerae]EJL7002277.1 hypothetical protein [Vibrio cholerae]EKF9165188.1 hypothetical protein [Vibrio cholerae]TXX51731.1 hypothetical protein FXF14_02940 [Vibrio cholerae]
MNQKLEKSIRKLLDDASYLHYRWELYKQLFASNSHRVDIINKTAPNIFVEFELLIIDYIVLEFSKLTDPAKSGKNKNLTLEFLVSEVSRIDGCEALSQKLRTILDEINRHASIFRKIRHKKVAHSDLVTLLGTANSLLPGILVEDVERLLSLVAEFMNEVESYFFDSETCYDEGMTSYSCDGRALVMYLQKALAYQQLEDDGLVEEMYWLKFGDIDS